jgi:DNA gyrase subunit A
MIRKRNSTNDAELIEFMVKRYKITDLQASYIINAQLKTLSMGHLDRFIQERDKLIELRNNAYDMIVHDDKIIDEIRKELIEIKKKYAVPRVCSIVNASVNDIPAGTFKIVVTQNNFIRKLQINDPIRGIRGDAVKAVIQADNRGSILIFDNMGKVYKLPISKIPMSDKVGTDIRFLVKNLTSDINTIIYEPDVVHFNDKSSKYFLLVSTIQGNIKKMDLADFTTVPPSGIMYTKLDSGDAVKSILIVNDRFDIIAWANKSAIRVPVAEIPHLKRNTKGSRIMTTKHPIEGISVIKPNSEFVIVVTRNGKINKFNSVALPAKQRGKSGNQVIKLSKNDSIVAMYGANSSDKIQVFTQDNVFTVNVSDIPSGSSIGDGAKVLNVQNDIIINCRLISE